MKADNLSNRMKAYEVVEAGRCLIPGLPALIRIDGKSFHTFTRGLERPYDKRLSDLMVDTTKFLVEQSNACIGHTQSDEINLCLYTDKPNTELYFNGKVQKLTSILTSMATAYFNSKLAIYIPEKANKYAYFDCRVWIVPNLVEAANVFVWRELDATKNAINMAASCYLSPTALHGKHTGEIQDMLSLEHGINFNDYPTAFKRGTYIRRVTKEVKFSVEELDRLPEKHAARTNPDILVNVVERIELPKIISIANRVDVLFNGADPILIT